MLPARINGPITTHCRAFGIYVEEHYTFWVVVLPALVALVFTLVITLCVLPVWLKDHPGDLQNATIPALLALNVVSIFINCIFSLFVVRMNL